MRPRPCWLPLGAAARVALASAKSSRCAPKAVCGEHVDRATTMGPGTDSTNTAAAGLLPLLLLGWRVAAVMFRAEPSEDEEFECAPPRLATPCTRASHPTVRKADATRAPPPRCALPACSEEAARSARCCEVIVWDALLSRQKCVAFCASTEPRSKHATDGGPAGRAEGISDAPPLIGSGGPLAGTCIGPAACKPATWDGAGVGTPGRKGTGVGLVKGLFP